MEIVCPAGTPAALRAAVKAGAHTVYCGFNDETNARNFPGLNFDRAEMREGVGFAHDHGSKALVAINTFPRAGDQVLWHHAIDDAAQSGADAVILADPGLLKYAARNHPGLRLHLSVQAAAANADIINFYACTFGVKRVVLPRVLSVPEIAAINAEAEVETEVFVFGGLCVMAEGRCSLSSYATGLSPNMNGVCSPASHVEYRDENGALDAKLGGFTIHRAAKNEPAPYPTLCKGCFSAGSQTGHLFEDPVSLNAEQLIPQLKEAGVTALKIEGRQRSKSYVAQVVRNFRAAVDALEAGQPLPQGMLARLSEGQAVTTGAYKKTWR
ncbi:MULTISPECIES: ubiquinone anaerobic biosynthesis protein UbiU [unclassified Leisingera]|uniref:ubiquinone anaerobic biosynthesis protein UbiU n=1 Tax=unclassified Leisingera TaxID=2614906 RepID=UPI00049277FE|nr:MULTISPECIES: peptidase U32 family protein [unclassified Leisingera]KIC23185.1 protease [Leisingera sp. ANG-S3]KIC52480.1 protease [Leisingera sp. ANG-S]KID07500.1 protease [Leisingera sp. ANG1]